MGLFRVFSKYKQKLPFDTHFDPPEKLRRKCLRDVLFIVRAGSDIITADFMHIKRTTFPTKMKTGILLEELK